MRQAQADGEQPGCPGAGHGDIDEHLLHFVETMKEAKFLDMTDMEVSGNLAIKRHDKVRDIIHKHGQVAKLDIYDGLKWSAEYVNRMARIKKAGTRKIRREEDRVDSNYFRFMDPALDIGEEVL